MTDEAQATAAVDAAGVVTAWSVQAESLLGYAAAEVLGRPAADLLAANEAGRGRTPPHALQHWAGQHWAGPHWAGQHWAGQHWAGQVAVRHRDGHRLDLWLRAHPVQQAAGRAQWFLVGFPAGSPPIGDPEDARRGGDIREMLDWAVTQTPVNVALLDMDMRHLRLNAAQCRVLGLETEAAGLGLRLTDLISSPGSEAAVARVRQVARTGEPTLWTGFDQAPGESRGHAWEVTLSAVKDPAGRVRGVLAVGLDVTEHHLARERLAVVNEASRRIGSTLDVTRTAEELVEVAVPRLADFAVIDLLDSVLRGDEPTSGPVAGTVPLRRLACGSVLDNSPEAVVRPGQVHSFPEHSPPADCLVTGQTVNTRDAGRNMARWEAQDPGRAAVADRYGFHSVMVVPVRARGARLGIAIFVRHQRPEPFEDDDLVLAEEIVARAAVCIDNARRYTREHATALTLQRSLLPRRLPAQAAVQVATRYLPAGSRAAVGGDWFDVIRLSGSRVGLVVGDVVGHGIHAAATMGRLRTAVRTLADIDLEPAELLTRLDDVVTRLADDEGLSPSGDSTDLSATCLYAVYDPVSRCCSIARAGHPLPAVVTPDGAAEFLDLPAGPPLGLGGLPFEEAEVELAEGSLLVLYTDGLIESRQRDIDTGLNAMRKVLSEVHLQPAGPPRAPPALETICDSLVEALLPERAEDDAALLVARTRALAADRIVSWDLPADPAVVADARARAARQLAAWGLEEITFTTEVVVSELVTNAIRYAQSPIQLRMILDGALSCEVSDGSSTAPHLRRADRYDEGGRGLMLVAQLTERWGSRHTRVGKTIWAEQPLPRETVS
jgi:PAS domain S-box-containing protein